MKTFHILQRLIQRSDMKRLLLTVTFLFFLCGLACADSSVWKAQKGKSIIYLGGTCHLLRETDFPLPEEFQKAYRASDEVVFETDLDKLQDPLIQQRLLQQATYSDGSTLKNHVSAKTYRELEAYADANGIPLASLSQFKPSMLMVTLTLFELMKMGVTQQGVDRYFYELARKEKKPVGQLETADEQIRFLASMGEGNEDQLISYSLKEMKTVREKFEALVEAWRRGDSEKLAAMMLDDLKGQQPKLYQTLILDRNRSWLRSIDGYEKSGKKRLMLVGVGHLVGPDGIIEALKRRGYSVVKLQADITQ